MTKRNKALILWFKNIGIKDVPIVGGKNAALGEMYRSLMRAGVNIPNGFAVTAHAYRYFLKDSGIGEEIEKMLKGLDTHNIPDLQKRGRAVRNLILESNMPEDLIAEITKAYAKLGKFYRKANLGVAVRSSATAEDLPGASFAGQQETYLNVMGRDEVVRAVRKAIASLFTNRAISYRVDKGFSHTDIALSVGVQKMVRSDKASSGVAFTIDTETGFDKVVVINSSYGLGEMIVQGGVIPDEFVVFKPMLGKDFNPIISRNVGLKAEKIIYSEKGTKQARVKEADRAKMSLSDKEVIKLAEWCVKVEKHFSGKRGKYQPMDIEWAKDGETNELFIVQARPETVQSSKDPNSYSEYRLNKQAKPFLGGIAVGTKIASGKARIIKDPRKITEFRKGEILVTDITDPDWEPIMKISSAIITDQGGRTSHAAIVSRELGIPCIVGTGRATSIIKTGETVTVDCSSGDTGAVYRGEVPFRVSEHHLDKMPRTKTKIMVNIGSPEEAFKNHYLPVKGVGLGRLEFIIASHVRIHPNALIDYKTLKKKTGDAKAKRIVDEIDELTAGHSDKKEFYVDKLTEGVAKIAAAFWPNDVIIRFSDFKTNEYSELIGGELYEPLEKNPMIGWRGASRYYDGDFREAFGLECRAIHKVRNEIGLKNVIPMIPFCRTSEEGQKVVETMKRHGLDRKKDRALKIYVMCEIPSNVVSANAFLDVFDGMSIGSNDLTQLVMGMDRDSAIISGIANENNPAVKKMIEDVIKICRKRRKYIGICGQAPSDFPEFSDFLVKNKIDSISLNPDSVIKIIPRVYKSERKISRIIRR
ncbi:MAG: phosphoenolpyruvate synthase [Candidatus Colwellbacteria bacterium RIFCSPHIGHO2_02_FULL_45_17]|uniref:Phosphoenolpyruvate synthase n=1 Tax=Candidatus Colwellbacteria bacterium RIFCSPLOWO2_12_FULL_46_17 TaxID=1797695 RepID=A0A1G1ZEA5_9BACT|nr:MAG: phosphoenolpyruvate synthase [Candidatus Colwellbacteria bacterium RIFCSPHIGHO2_02_FULL_45_17]OGY62117.1 MAG: phosphoenolpyruvate synthase [Candidatus Colwellbacteria bacterium RIFCSPLOWO2_12_FULL_46_17]